MNSDVLESGKCGGVKSLTFSVPPGQHKPAAVSLGIALIISLDPNRWLLMNNQSTALSVSPHFLGKLPYLCVFLVVPLKTEQDNRSAVWLQGLEMHSKNYLISAVIISQGSNFFFKIYK